MVLFFIASICFHLLPMGPRQLLGLSSACWKAGHIPHGAQNKTLDNMDVSNCLYNFMIFYRCVIICYHVIQLCSNWSFELGEASCEAMLFITMWLFLRSEAAEWSQQISVFGLNHVEPFLHVLTCVLSMALHNDVFRMFDCKNFRKSDWSLALNFFRQLPLQEARRSV